MSDHRSEPPANALRDAEWVATTIERSLAEFREAVEARVERGSATAEEGVLVAGKSIDFIFREAKAAAAVARSRQGSGPDIHALAAHQSEHVQAFVSELEEVLDDQAGATRRAMKQSATISEAGIRINEIATNVRVLGLNAQIEATRLGGAGAAFKVIAYEMHELGKQVALANALIGELVNNLSAALPELLENGERMREKSQDFTDILAEDIRLMEDANQRTQAALRAANVETEQRLERIRLASNDALSGLQFHDPMVQHLRQLPSLVDEVARRTETIIESSGLCPMFEPLEDSLHQQVFVAEVPEAVSGLVMEF